jgi:hypothetical protein
LPNVAKENLIMCLLIRENFQNFKAAQRYKPKVTTRARYVYKLVNLNLRSHVYNFPYEWGRKYSIKKFGKDIDGNPYSGYRLEIHEGFHAYTTLAIANHKVTDAINDVRVIRCKIPAGSEYFLGSNGEIVSNCLVWPKKI